MVGQSHCHCRTPLLITPPTRKPLGFLPQCRVRPHPVVLKQAQNYQRIPGLRPFGKPVGLPGQRIQTIPQDPVQPLYTNRIWARRRLPHHGPDFHAHNPPPPPSLDGLGKPHARGRNQGWASPLPGPLRVPIDPHDLRAIDTSPITHPGNPGLPCRSLTGQPNRQGRRFVLRGPKDQATTKRVGRSWVRHPQRGPTPPDGPVGSPGSGRFFLQMTRRHPPPPR